MWGEPETKLPTPEQVKLLWQQVVEEESLGMMREISSLSIGQRKVLVEMAAGKTKNLLGNALLAKVGLSSGAVIKVLNVLEQKDFIERLGPGYFRIIDPVIKFTLNKHYGDL